MIIKYVIIFIASVVLLQLFPSLLHAQDNSDTLTRAKEFIKNKDYRAACKILKPFYMKHPGKLNTQWLYAQALFGKKKIKESEKVYEDAIAWHPENYYLRLDYAEKLVDAGQFKKAIPILKLYSAYDSNALDLHLMYAKIAFWKGDYKTAEAEMQRILKKQTNPPAYIKEFQNEILTAEAPWLKPEVEYYTDTQPMRTITPEIAAGFFVCPLSTLQFNLLTPVYVAGNSAFTAQWLQAENKSYFSSMRMTLNEGIGVIKLPNNTSTATGKVELNKSFFTYLKFDVFAAHLPYLYAIADLYNPVMMNSYQSYLAWQNPNSWQAQATINYSDFFASENYVYSISFYGLTPPFKKIKGFKFFAGYAFNYQTSKYSAFVPDESVEQVVENWESTTTINGVYNPYFTPQNQIEHFLILSANAQLSKKIVAGAKLNVPIYATTLNPYLYLNKNNEDQIYITRGFSEMQFYPAEIDLFATLKISSEVGLRADYIYLRNNFYTSNFYGISSQICLAK